MPTPLLDRDLRTYPASARLCHCLINEGFKTLREVRTANVAGLMTVPNFGKKTMVELEALLAEREPPQGMQRPEAMRRALDAAQMKTDGLTYRAIGEHYGFTVERARQLVCKGQRLIERSLI